VKVIRPAAVAQVDEIFALYLLMLMSVQMAALLDNAALHTAHSSVSEILYAAAWVVGEFSEYLATPVQVVQAMLQPRVTALPGPRVLSSVSSLILV
jgi:hypothetical protein